MSNAPTSPADAAVPAPCPRRPVLTFLRRRLEGWRLRHQLPVNFWLHMAGIPMAMTGLVLLLLLPWYAPLPWYWAAGLFVVGYFLQWVGHRLEGNDVGEWAAIKRLLGLPYVGISPRWNPDDPSRL
jgi:hypothetical protein